MTSSWKSITARGWFALIERKPTLWRCRDCAAVTDRPEDHLRWHAGGPATVETLFGWSDFTVTMPGERHGS